MPRDNPRSSVLPLKADWQLGEFAIQQDLGAIQIPLAVCFSHEKPLVCHAKAFTNSSTSEFRNPGRRALNFFFFKISTYILLKYAFKVSQTDRGGGVEWGWKQRAVRLSLS